MKKSRVNPKPVENPSQTNGTPESASRNNSPARTEPVSERFPALEKEEVTLTCFAPEAKQVNVAGNFNNWRPEATPLKHTDTGEWAIRLMLRSGEYEYRFVVDGRWTDDPRAPQHVPNPYGDFNSVLKVPLDDRTDAL